MKLELDDDLRAKLRAVRAAQMDELTSGRLCLVDHFFADNEVVRIKAGFGYGTYVGTDGQVTVQDFGQGTIHVLERPSEIASVVVRWADNVGLGELRDLLPKKPTNAITCAVCDGLRFVPLQRLFPGAENGANEEILCTRCSGLGWVASEA